MHRNKANHHLKHSIGLCNLWLCVRGLQLPLPGVNAVYIGTLNMLTTQKMNNLKTYYSLPVVTFV